jgi:hypothetical protein
MPLVGAITYNIFQRSALKVARGTYNPLQRV